MPCFKCALFQMSPVSMSGHLVADDSNPGELLWGGVISKTRL